MPAINSGHLNATPDLAVTLPSRSWPPPSLNNSQVLKPKRVDLPLTAASVYIIVYLIRGLFFFNRYTFVNAIHVGIFNERNDVTVQRWMSDSARLKT